MPTTSPTQKAMRTAKWAVTMAKWDISFVTNGRVIGGKKVPPTRRWNLVTFLGRGDRESAGIVDLLAIRKDHRVPDDPLLKRGDLFEIILIQVKGGTARKPTKEDENRLQRVARHYRVNRIVLADWQRGRRPTFSMWTKGRWNPLDDPREVFA